MTEKQLIAWAIGPMFDACGNSYINAWLQRWLESAKALGVYEGPTIGTIADIDVSHWCEVANKNVGLAE
jgi:hypothetical protein